MITTPAKSLAQLFALLAAGAAAAPESGSFAPVIARIAPPVVAVEAWSKAGPVALTTYPAFERFLNFKREVNAAEQPEGRRESATAFVTDADAGLLVTAGYVLRDAARVQVRLAGGEIRPASVAERDVTVVTEEPAGPP